LLDALLRYLEEIESAVRDAKGVYVEHYREEILTNSPVNLRIRIRFPKGLLLEISEHVISDAGDVRHLSYRYHFLDERNSLIFRYDSTPHFVALKNFPITSIPRVGNQFLPTIHS